MQVDNPQFFERSQYNIGSRVLSIQNVTAEDEGQYICRVILSSSKTNNSTFTLKVFSKLQKHHPFNMSINLNFILFYFCRAR